MLEGQDSNLIAALEATSNVDDSLARKRGFVHVIDSDPSRIELPPRCLPVYLLDGRRNATGVSVFENRLRRMTMLEDFRRSSARELVVISAGTQPVPTDLSDLWSAGYRAHLAFVSDSPSAESDLKQWLNATPDVAGATLVQTPPQQLIENILVRYYETYPADRNIIRMRDGLGQLHKIDITTADELERPILDSYALVEERDLTPLVPEELSRDEFVGFFKNPECSWRPYAAGLPWVRDTDCRQELRRRLQRLDMVGPDENCIAYISSEPGAGGTTLARVLAWEFAREGYPVLAAKPYPFVPDALPITNYLTRVHRLYTERVRDENPDQSEQPDAHSTNEKNPTTHLYETPWIIVFDTIHWQHRDAELLQFRNELTKSGRPVCLLVVTGSYLGLTFLTSPTFREVAALNHTLQLSEARKLGQHLNKFLRYYGQARTRAQWERFYEEHTVRDVAGIASFWVTLSFWIQGQYDFAESIQQWIYASFKEQAEDPIIQDALLQIAAMSSERQPLPQALLPKVSGQWPVWQLIDDKISDLARLGLTRIIAQGERAWALVHDILGRLLINALFYDHPTREALGFVEATNPEHLRFLILRKISENPRLGELAYKPIGETFATEIFKIDPSLGKINFAELWRDVLDALDKMSPLLRDTSRVFRHHTAVSRRRIAMLDSTMYTVDNTDKIELLRRAVKDINYALTEIAYSMSSEPDLNLLNSLARAYFDLAEAEREAGAPDARIAELIQLANEMTRRAYRENPNNSFVIETYVRSLLRNARDTPKQAMENCVMALGALYSAPHVSITNSRGPQLSRLADDALEILLKQAPSEISAHQPQNAIDVLVQTWLILAGGSPQQQEWLLEQVPIQIQKQALKALAHPAGQGNLQVLHLRYDLTCNCYPYDYRQQIELLEPLRISEYWLSSQLQLEYAILLFQTGRADEGDKAFRSLRDLWRTSNQFVQVPERLRWLRAADGKTPQVVQATSGSGYGPRVFALVREFANARVLFRPEEHGFADPRPGLTFSCYVSFGHNGPFLRPLSARPPLAK
ncbi:MAG: hypothetical protein JXA89_28630 [Anaerolineae bacterium]|nr:hypothetical protein [Anaerolineae bacterium]